MSSSLGLVRHNNLGPILHTLRDILYDPTSSTIILGVFPLDQIADVGVSQSNYFKLIFREIIFEVFTVPQRDRRMDGQTDKRTYRRHTMA